MLKKLPEVIADIQAGKSLLLAGDETLLKGLPRGNWIGGTIPYFMAETGGVISAEHLYVNELPATATMKSIRMYEAAELSGMLSNAPQNGFTVLIIPATSPAHSTYAHDAPDYPDLFMKPVIGWISGVNLADLGSISPKVFDGMSGEASDAKAVAMHCDVPAGKVANIGIVNLFKQGNGDSIIFEDEGFTVSDAYINGKKRNFAEYLKTIQADTKLPLVANYCGAMVNVSFQSLNESGTVSLYAPVFKGVEYKLASPVSDYISQFKEAVPSLSGSPVFSCNCILNFLYSELEGKKIGSMFGPITFGEIAYQLLNQTLVYLEIK